VKRRAPQPPAGGLCRYSSSPSPSFDGPTRKDEGMSERYEGKAKVVETMADDEGLVRVTFKDDATAGNGAKKDSFARKGETCAAISTLLFEYLTERGVASHYVRRDGDRAFIARKVDIVPLEVVVRNVAAGSLCRRTGLPQGATFAKPIVEYYYKDDELGDPLLNHDHIEALGVAADDELDRMRLQALRVNDELTSLFDEAGLRLVDFKLEFGRLDGDIVLADEISPDTCRLWDGERSLDKDVFRRGDGSPVGGYEEVLTRLRRLRGAAESEA